MPTFDHSPSQVVPPDALECSVDECRSVPILGETIRYWGMETWIYLCPEHLVEKRRNGMEIDAEGNTIEEPKTVEPSQAD